MDVIKINLDFNNNGIEGSVAMGNLLLPSKQDRLVSGINIKTIEGQSILGTGDLKLNHNSKQDKNRPNNNEIWYNTNTEEELELESIEGYEIISNIYNSDVGYYIITFKDNIYTLPSAFFQGNLYLKEIILPDCINEIEPYAFSESTLESIILPENLEILGGYALSRTQLTSIELPKKLTNIGNYALSEIDTLSYIYIPESISFIGEHAITASIVALSHRIPINISSLPFGIDISKIYIPLNTLSLYLQDPTWSQYEDLFEEVLFTDDYFTLDSFKTINGISILGNGNIELNKESLQLGRVDNTRDIDKPISTATQAALDGKANNGTTLEEYGITNAYTKEETESKIDEAISNIISNAPETFDTLKEIAEWIEEDESGTAALIQEVESKVDKTELAEELSNKANIKGRYSQMSVGFADNLVGRGEATTEEFSYRPTAGGLSIESGAARIKAIKGNSVVWNQLVNNLRVSSNTTSVTVTDNGDGSFTLNGTVPEDTYFQFICDSISYIQGHKIYITSYGDVNVTTTQIASNKTGNFIEGRIVTVAEYETSAGFRQNLYAGQTYNNVVIRPSIFDLTQMFGVGNEPTTIEEFYQRMPIGIDTNTYNGGEIIDMKVNAIETVGFNQWDEQWEVGLLSGSNGQVGNSTNAIRSKNFNKCLPNTTYYIDPRIAFFVYDKDENYITFIAETTTYTTPSNAAFFKISTRGAANYGATYKGDICVNLSHTGYKNGTYQPYETFTRNLPIISKYFPNGMRSAGNASDEIRFNNTTQKWEAVQNVGVVDLGTLTFNNPASNGTNDYISSVELPNKKNGYYNVLCSDFTTIPPNTYKGISVSVGEISGSASTKFVFFGVESGEYESAADFKSAMQGVMLNYELETPIVTEITEDNINFDYDVEDFGTEEAIANVPSAPFHADIIYQLNAVDRIRQNTLSIEELRTLVVNLQTQLTALTNNN